VLPIFLIQWKLGMLEPKKEEMGNMSPDEYPYHCKLDLSHHRLRPLPVVKPRNYLTIEEEDILRKRFKYYNELPLWLQPRFCKRLAHFMRHKDFEGRQELEPTTEMKVLISAAAIKLTFGLDDYMLDHFRKIIVYPEIYYSKLSKTYNKGEASEHGIIVFSWDNFVESLEEFDNGINLGFHEYSHALLMMCSNNDICDSCARDGYGQLCLLLSADHLSSKVYETGLFRDYAFKNKMEFFAVSVENFFERPNQLREKCRELYDLLRFMLNQDPAAEVKISSELPRYSE
jgi:Mlc titration factor MtfA (ptsG expression regulator)